TTATPLTHRQSPYFPPYSHSLNILLIANLTSPTDLSPPIHLLPLTSYHTSPCYDYAVLLPPSTPGTGRSFYQNGTAEEIRYGRGNLLSDGGTPPSPYGFIVPDTANAQGEKAVAINCGPGSAGVQISRFPDPTPQVAYKGGKFYVCYREVVQGQGVWPQVFFREWEEKTPEGCVEVNLLPQCVGGGAGHQFGADVNCYADVAGID
ncbi:hypothetical protein K402DRAFT_303813, partial [Aulographum hederae CBS 113979]